MLQKSFQILRIRAYAIGYAWLVISLSFISISSMYANSIVIDGWFDDWKVPQVTLFDPLGDNEGLFDLTSLSVKSAGTKVYIRFSLSHHQGLQAGAPCDFGLRLKVSTINRRGFILDFRDKSIKSLSNLSNVYQWKDLDYLCLPTYASNEYELCFDATSIGLSSGEKIYINFEGSDWFAKSATIRLKPLICNSSSSDVDIDKPQGSLRIGCYNTMFDGLSDTQRSSAFHRILSAFNCDISCFVEEFNETQFRSSLANVLPTYDTKNIVWRDGKAIVTKLPMETVQFGLIHNECAAIVTTETGGKILVVVAHLACCGYAGSSEDCLREKQVHSIIDLLAQVKSNNKSYKTIPAVVVGDFNLVGSRNPLSIIERNAGLTEARLLSLDRTNAITWRSLQSDSFSPGRLDYIAYDANALKRVGGAIVDTSRISKNLLRGLKLIRSDSSVSDHLFIYADFQLNNQYDTVVTNRDTTANYPASFSQADKDHDQPPSPESRLHLLYWR